MDGSSSGDVSPTAAEGPRADPEPPRTTELMLFPPHVVDVLRSFARFTLSALRSGLDGRPGPTFFVTVRPSAEGDGGWEGDGDGDDVYGGGEGDGDDAYSDSDDDDNDDAYGGGGGGFFGSVPASGVAIACLPETTAREEAGEHCAVCLVDYEDGDALRTMPCAHSFHESCIFRWLIVSRLCPLCRFALPAEGEEETDVDDGHGEAGDGTTPHWSDPDHWSDSDYWSDPDLQT